MAEAPFVKFEVKPINGESLSPSSIVLSPRTYKPQDVEAACQNMRISRIEAKGTKSNGEQPSQSLFKEFENVGRYILGDFFMMAHRTGLYNRQLKVWEALSRVCQIDVYQVSTGFFTKKTLEQYDLVFLDHRSRPLILVQIIKPSAMTQSQDILSLFKKECQKASKLEGLNGIFFCLPKPFPEKLNQFIFKLIQGDNAIHRYESVLPPPHNFVVNLLELEYVDGLDDLSGAQPFLIHPDLNTGKKVRTNWKEAEPV